MGRANVVIREIPGTFDWMDLQKTWLESIQTAQVFLFDLRNPYYR